METLEKIVSASTKLFMNYGLKSISMDDIAGELGISKKTIYKHVSTKDKLIQISLLKYLKREKKIIRNIITNSDNAVEEIINIGRHVINMARKLKPTLMFDLKKYHSKIWSILEEHHFNFIQEIIESNLNRGMSEGYFRHNIEPDIIAKMYVQKSLMVGNEKDFSSEKYKREDLFKQHLLYHLYGVLSGEGIKIAQQYGIEAI